MALFVPLTARASLPKVKVAINEPFQLSSIEALDNTIGLSDDANRGDGNAVLWLSLTNPV